MESLNTIICVLILLPAISFAAIFVKVQGVSGATTPGYDNGEWFQAASFSFEIERKMKESGEKGGTEDIGVGELMEYIVSRSMDIASAKLMQHTTRAAPQRSISERSLAKEHNQSVSTSISSNVAS